MTHWHLRWLRNLWKNLRLFKTTKQSFKALSNNPSPLLRHGNDLNDFTSVVEKNVLIWTPSENLDNTQDRPLSFLFGWAGANHKNLSKYSDIHLGRGHTTAQLLLPTNFVFRHTEKVPELMMTVLEHLVKSGVSISERPVYVHCLSDTGVMCYQGMMEAGERLDIRGVVWDSCCGPRPQVTAARIPVYMLINYMCSKKDGLSNCGAVYSSYRLLMDRGYPGLLARLRGEELPLSLIGGIWSGDWGRHHHKLYPKRSELFLYSDKDFYLRARYLEDTALAERDAAGADYSKHKFSGSGHVSHLRLHSKTYINKVEEFITKTEAERR